MQVKCFSSETCNGCALKLLPPETKRRLGLAVQQVVTDHGEELNSVSVARAGGDQQANVARTKVEGWLQQVKANTTGDVPILIGGLDSNEIALGATAVRRAVLGDCGVLMAEVK